MIPSSPINYGFRVYMMKGLFIWDGVGGRGCLYGYDWSLLGWIRGSDKMIPSSPINYEVDE